MNDLRNDSSAFRIPRPEDDADRESRHQVLATLLGAYADAEVPDETASQIDAHLLGCARCRRELDVHRAIRVRLEGESIAPASAALRERILSGIASTPIERSNVPVALAPVGGWWSRATRPARALLLLAISTAVVTGAVAVRSARGPRSMPVTEVSVASLPLLTRVLDDYRRVIATDLPGRSRDLATVRAALPFPVAALVSPELRLLAAWTTDLAGEQAAVLAYRWHDQLVLQYVVSEPMLFRPAEIRRAFADGHQLAARAGAQSVIAWPERERGELLVADLRVSELALLRATVSDR